MKRKMTLEDALTRIEALEAEVAKLRAQPAQQFHYIYQPQPVYVQPTYLPQPQWTWPQITCAGSATYGG